MLCVLSVFSGAGGDSLGLSQAGFSIEAAVEIDKDACKTYKDNIPSTRVYRKDVCDISLVQNDFDGILSDLTGISGGPPCQGSSRLNIRGKGKERNRLTFEVIRLASEGNLSYFIIENVPTFALKEQVMRQGKRAGYTMFAKVLNSGDFGVPQLRRRWFCIGLKDKDTFHWPTPAGTTPTVRDALAQMDAVWGTAQRSPRIMSCLDALDTTPGIWYPISNGTFENAIAWELDKPAPCLTHTEKMYQKIQGIPGTIPQSLSALIQGFPPSWKFSGPKRSVAQQIVNACPPSLARAIGTAIKTTLSPTPAASSTASGNVRVEGDSEEVI